MEVSRTLLSLRLLKENHKPVRWVPLPLGGLPSPVSLAALCVPATPSPRLRQHSSSAADTGARSRVRPLGGPQSLPTEGILHPTWALAVLASIPLCCGGNPVCFHPLRPPKSLVLEELVYYV